MLLASNAYNSQGKHVQQKLTLMSHITETKGTSNDILRFIQVEIIGALNGSKSE